MFEEIMRWATPAAAVAALGLLMVTTMCVYRTKRAVQELLDARLSEYEPILLVDFGFEPESESADRFRTVPQLKNVGRGCAINVRYQWLISTDYTSPPRSGQSLYGIIGEQYTLMPAEEADMGHYDSNLEAVGRYFWLAIHYEDAQRNANHRMTCYALGGGRRLISDALYRTQARKRPAFSYDRPLFPASGAETVFSVTLRSPARDLQGRLSVEREYLQQHA